MSQGQSPSLAEQHTLLRHYQSSEKRRIIGDIKRRWDAVSKDYLEKHHGNVIWAEWRVEKDKEWAKIGAERDRLNTGNYDNYVSQTKQIDAQYRAATAKGDAKELSRLSARSESAYADYSKEYDRIQKEYWQTGRTMEADLKATYQERVTLEHNRYKDALAALRAERDAEMARIDAMTFGDVPTSYASLNSSADCSLVASVEPSSGEDATYNVADAPPDPLKAFGEDAPMDDATRNFRNIQTLESERVATLNRIAGRQNTLDDYGDELNRIFDEAERLAGPDDLAPTARATWDEAKKQALDFAAKRAKSKVRDLTVDDLGNRLIDDWPNDQQKIAYDAVKRVGRKIDLAKRRKAVWEAGLNALLENSKYDDKVRLEKQFRALSSQIEGLGPLIQRDRAVLEKIDSEILDRSLPSPTGTETPGLFTGHPALSDTVNKKNADPAPKKAGETAPSAGFPAF